MGDRSGPAPHSPLFSRRQFVLNAGIIACAGLMGAKARAELPRAADIQAAQAEKKVVIYATTDSEYAQPLYDAFTRKYGIAVEQNALATSSLYSQVIAEAAANQVGSDVVWSAAMDLQMALQAAGLAQPYVSEQTRALPAWARYKDTLFATSVEPVGFAYNTRALQAEELPRTYAELIRFIAESPKLKGHVATTDAEKSGLAYMFHANDAKSRSDYWQLAAAMGKAGVKTYLGSSNVLESITSGENALATHIISSYALQLQKKNPNLRAHFLTDYAPCLMRVSFISAGAPRPNAARLLQDFMLSREGQDITAASGLPAVRQDGTSSPLAKLKAMTGVEAEPIKLDETLLENIDKTKRLAFVREWKKAIGR
jgi:iron(III) transport system substrate-binding protein